MALLPATLASPLGGVPGLAGPTVADIIRGAFRVLGVVASGEAPSAQEQADGLEALNEMLDSWATEHLTLFATSRNAYALTPGLNPHTIGLEGAPSFAATRPVRIDRASVVLASSPNSELPLSIVDDAAWQITQGKTTTGTPVYLWPQMTYPLINLWLNPVPVNADSLVLYTWQQLGSFSSVFTLVDLPPGYKRALRFNLAKELAPEYGVTLSPEAADNANESKANLKRINNKPAFMRSDGALLRRGPFNVVSGDRG